MPIIKSLLLTILIGITLAPNAKAQSVVYDTDAEIQHLLNYIKLSDCAFYRNNSKHDALNAHKHINKKYKHYKKKIRTAEQFIELAASKSLFSGKPYFIQCPQNKEPELHSQWLQKELKNYRNNKH